MVCRQDTSTHTVPLLGSYFITILMALSVNVARTVQTEGAARIPFRVVWNYPDRTCHVRNTDFQLSKYGIVVNTPRAFVGNEVATLYVQKVGLWPSFKNNDLTKPINGGIPQMGNLTSHLEKIRKDIADQIREDSTGYGVLDQEIWRTLYDMNFGVYSIYKEIMEKSLQVAQSVRPNVRWGYYLHPQTWWSTSKTQAINDRLDWLYKASTGIYPSIYIKDATVASASLMGHRIKETLAEAIRVRAVHSRPSSPIVAYTMVQSGDHFFSENILDYAIGQPAEMGIDGVIIWGSSNLFKTKPAVKCNAIKKYVQDILGPYVSQLTNRLTNCSISKCGGQGRCIRKDYAQSVPHILDKKSVTRQTREASSEAADHKGNAPLVKRATYPESLGVFSRRYLAIITGLSNWSPGLAWLRSSEELSQGEHSSEKDIFANINQSHDRETSTLPQEQNGRTMKASLATLFPFQRITGENMNASSSTDTEVTTRHAITTLYHSSTSGTAPTGQPPSSNTDSEPRDVNLTNKPNSSSYASQTISLPPDVTANFGYEISSLNTLNVTSTFEHTDFDNNDYSITTSEATVHKADHFIGTTPCSDDLSCVSKGIRQDSRGEVLTTSFTNVNNVFTMGHSIFDSITALYNYYLGAAHQRNRTLVDQRSNPNRTLVDQRSNPNSTLVDQRSNPNRTLADQRSNPNRTLADQRSNPGLEESDTKVLQAINGSNTVTAAESPSELYTVSTLQNSSTDINKTINTFILDVVDTGNRNMFQEHVTVSQIPTPTEEFDNYVCQCYDDFQGPKCEHRNIL